MQSWLTALAAIVLPSTHIKTTLGNSIETVSYYAVNNAKILSLIDWISDTRPQGWTDLQSQVNAKILSAACLRSILKDFQPQSHWGTSHRNKHVISCSSAYVSFYTIHYAIDSDFTIQLLKVYQATEPNDRWQIESS